MDSMEDLKEGMKKNRQELKLKNRKIKLKEIIGNKRLKPTSNTDENNIIVTPLSHIILCSKEIF